MALYHADLGLPSWFRAPTGTLVPTYGRHAWEAAHNDRFGFIQLPAIIDFAKFRVIEVEADGRTVTKVVLRGPLDARRDICIVLTSTGFVKTVWVNLRTDTHRTLDRARYQVPACG